MAGALPYNGWTGLVRMGSRYGAYKRARRRRVLAAAPICSCCNTSLPADCVPYHAEEYGPTHEAFWDSCVPLCHRCHAMLHARFRLPNMWKLLLGQAADGAIDEGLFPPRKSMAKMKARPDTAYVPMPAHVPGYFSSLPLTEYIGPWKPATLRVRELGNGSVIEVPDWLTYGEDLRAATSEEVQGMRSRGVNVDGFLAGDIRLPRQATGALRYDPLYLSPIERRPRQTVARTRGK